MTITAKFVCLVAAVLPVFAAADYGAMRGRVAELGKLTSVPAVHEASLKVEGVRALYFDSVAYKGKPTRVFAFYGAPASRTGKVPGIVLVHGGGGTAYAEWVRKWNEHGFAAISIAVEGQTPEPDGPQKWKRQEWGGPARNGIYGDSAEPVEDQWMYHAVAATVLANSLIRSFPEVDAARVGVMGISWGGVITSTVMGLDSRFAFAIPTYGCGAMATAENQWGRALGENAVYREVWDPVLWLPKARMPALWLTWLHDVHFPLTSQSASYLSAPGPRMVSVIPDMKHSHPAGWNPLDSYAFAESVVRDGKAWMSDSQVRRDGDKVVFEFSSSRPVDGAVLQSTTERGFTGSLNWRETVAVVADAGKGRWRVTATVPEGSVYWFVNVRSGGLTASSDLLTSVQ